MARSGSHKPAPRRRAPAPRSESAAAPWEWAVAALGALVVVAFLGYLGWNAVTSGAAPPAIAVEVERIERQGERYLVTFRAVNRGAAAAEGVKITGRLRRDGKDLEESEATLQYIPARSHRRGGMFFSSDPTAGALELRAEGFSKP